MPGSLYGIEGTPDAVFDLAIKVLANRYGVSQTIAYLMLIDWSRVTHVEMGQLASRILLDEIEEPPPIGGCCKERARGRCGCARSD